MVSVKSERLYMGLVSLNVLKGGLIILPKGGNYGFIMSLALTCTIGHFHHMDQE